jgi:hypothetical protein
MKCPLSINWLGKEERRNRGKAQHQLYNTDLML